MGPGALGKKWKKSKKILFFFCEKYYFFGWIFIVHAISFLLKYVKVLYLKIWNFALFWHEKSHFWPSSFDSLLRQTYKTEEAVLDVYVKLKIKIFIWEQVLGNK